MNTITLENIELKEPFGCAQLVQGLITNKNYKLHFTLDNDCDIKFFSKLDTYGSQQEINKARLLTNISYAFNFKLFNSDNIYYMWEKDPLLSGNDIITISNIYIEEIGE